MKNKKKKSKKEVKSIIGRIILIILVISIIFAAVYYFLTAEDEDSSLTLLEKQWIEKNKKTLMDIEIPNNVSIIGNTGEGLVFKFLNDLEETTGLALNKIPYNYPGKYESENLAVLVLKDDEKLSKDDLLIYKDNYILMSLDNSYISDISKINNTTVGTLNTDGDIVKNYLNDNVLTIKTYTSIDYLISALEQGTIKYMIIPRYAYLDTINGKTNIYVNYNLGLSNKIILRSGSNDKLNNIVSKNLTKWLKDEFTEDFEESLLGFYETNNKLTEIDKSTLNKKVYRYGYLKDEAYNVVKTGNLYGIAGEYINTIKNMLGMDFEYEEYDSRTELEKDLKTGKLDIAYVNYDYKNDKYLNSSSPFEENMVVLGKKYLSVNDKNSLINTKVYTKENSAVYDYLESFNLSLNKIKTYGSSIPSDSLLVLDDIEYLYLKDGLLSEYKYLFSSSFEGNYHFVVNKSHDKLFEILQFVLNNTDSNEYRVKGINNLNTMVNNQTNFKEMYIILLGIILLPICAILLSLIIARNSKKIKILKKENVLKYNDMLTNLKNRNYLNDNIDGWDDTKIYPKTIIIVDLNNLKYVNDNYGHKEGNDLIKHAGAVLINTQLEKSEIVRTDGNEFLIYLLGYSKSQVSTYVSKLSKEFEKLPHGFGAAIGYSMIEDEIKTIDDAINEATIDMRMDKEKNYR